MVGRGVPVEAKGPPLHSVFQLRAPQPHTHGAGHLLQLCAQGHRRGVVLPLARLLLSQRRVQRLVRADGVGQRASQARAVGAQLCNLCARAPQLQRQQALALNHGHEQARGVHGRQRGAAAAAGRRGGRGSLAGRRQQGQALLLLLRARGRGKGVRRRRASSGVARHQGRGAQLLEGRLCGSSVAAGAAGRVASAGRRHVAGAAVGSRGAVRAFHFDAG